MGVLNLRNVDDGLVERLKVAAVRSGRGFHEFCVQLLAQGVSSEVVQVVREKAKRVEKRTTVDAVGSSAVLGIEALRVDPEKKVGSAASVTSRPGCPTCGKTAVLDYGRNWHCEACGRNFPK